MLDLITEKEPPPNRRLGCDGPMERHLTEAAVMLAYATHLAETTPSLSLAEIHPDGEHGKRFEIRDWLEKRGFKLVAPSGTTSYGGRYERDGLAVLVSSKPGLGDVEASVDGKKVVAECKGGIVNTRHAGQVSRLRRGLCEAVGLLLARPPGDRQVAVVPLTPATLALARRMLPRARAAGIAIALVREDGSVVDVSLTSGE